MFDLIGVYINHRIYCNYKNTEKSLGLHSVIVPWALLLIDFD